MNSFARPLNNKEIVENFILKTLNFNYKAVPELNGIISKIVDAQFGIEKVDTAMQTLNRLEMRNSEYREENARWVLRNQIIEELFTLKRVSDAEMRLGNGGALPNSPVQSNKQAFILIGLPASGKSTIANQIAEDFGAIIVDSDNAKMKLPEYADHLYGATVVNDESSQITSGFDGENEYNLKCLYFRCLEKGHNIILPRIGENPLKIHRLATALKQNNEYDVHLILVSLPKRDATIRAIHRFAATKRYVPLGLIFDGYGNDPTLTYYYLRSKYLDLFSSMGCLSTKTNPQEYTDCIGNSPVLTFKPNHSILSLL